MAQASYFRGPASGVGNARQGAVHGILGRIGRWIAEWRRLRRQARTEAELRHKLDGYDAHLLRDMGFVRNGDRIERVEPGWNCPFGRQSPIFGTRLDPINPDWNPWR
jgi:uncharacterized protein YjiS (DUF1127 family)